jgi:hypothetical protein
VVLHAGQADRRGGGLALQHHAQGITDQQDVDTGLVQQGGEGGVVAGQHGDLLAAAVHVLQAMQGDGLAGFGHGKCPGTSEGRAV